MNTTTTNPAGSQTSYDDSDHPHRATALERPAHGRMAAGVAAGAARYLGVDPTVIRILFAVLAVAGGIGIPLYVAGWLLIPEEGSEESLASEILASFQNRSR